MGARRGAGLWMHAVLGASVALALIASYAQSASETEARAERDRHRPVEKRAHGYVSSRECRSCHPQHYDSWFHSYHRTMTQPATPESVFGDWNDVVLKQGEQRIQLTTEGADFVMRVLPKGAGPEQGERQRGPLVEQLPQGDHTVALVTGSHHMQVYWYETGQGRALGQLPFAYLKEEQRWIPRRMAFLRPPTKFRPGEMGRWNSTCIHCHTTHGQPRPGGSEGHDTRVAEMGIACEACHGPGRRHLARYASPLTRYSSHVDDGDDDTGSRIVNPTALDHQRASQVCSQCHAMWQFEADEYKRWAKDGYSYRPGDDPEDTMWLFAPSRADSDPRVAQVVKSQHAYTEGQFWSDGQARVSGREYNGMVDSACFTDGEISCMSCHSMHKTAQDTRSHGQWADDQLDVGMASDRACVQCHEDLGADLTAHTRHAAGSEGSRCYNCHMPYTSYGLLKAIRSHKITNPTAEETLETGRPNACNMCHLDKSLAWTADALRTRFGVKSSVDFGEHRAIASSVELALKGDAAQRALIAWAYGWPAARQASGDGWMPAFLGILMDDPYDAVRFIAHKSLRGYPGHDDLQYDFVRGPREREAIAPEVARRAAANLGQVPAQIPLDPGGQPNDTTAALLEQRDHTPINLLE